MKKRPLIFMITDIHLTGDNTEEVKNIILQAIAEAKALGFDYIYIAGDIFDSRKAQSLRVLEAWLEILDLAAEHKIILRVIPGNHDKPSYKSERSYLDLYGGHSNIELVRDYEYFYEDDGWIIHMIPFFDEKETYPKYLNAAIEAVADLNEDYEQDPNKHILITHIAVDGVRNNDGSQIEDTLSANSFKIFNKVFVGHYHNYQEVDNIIYFGAIKQKDFGEDKRKGYTVVYDDGSISQGRFLFKEYEVIKINLNTTTDEEVNKILEKYKNPLDNIRFKFTGTREKLRAIDKSKYEDLGIDVKCEEDDPEVNLDYTELKDFKGFDKESIKEGWDSFGELNEIEEEVQEQGKNLLTEILG